MLLMLPPENSTDGQGRVEAPGFSPVKSSQKSKGLQPRNLLPNRYHPKCCHPEEQRDEGSAFPRLRHETGCPILSRTLRKGGKAQTQTSITLPHLIQYQRNRLCHPVPIPPLLLQLPQSLRSQRIILG